MQLTTDLHPSGRFTLYTLPPELPRKCVVCSNTGEKADRQFVDFGYSEEMYGVLYWCTVCLFEVCNSLGWINKEQWEELKNQVEFTRDLNDFKEGENVKLRLGLSSLNFLGNRCSCANNPAISGNQDDSIKPQLSSIHAGEDGNSVQESDSGPIEQITVGGHEDLQDSDEFSPNESDDDDEFRI